MIEKSKGHWPYVGKYWTIVTFYALQTTASVTTTLDSVLIFHKMMILH